MDAREAELLEAAKHIKSLIWVVERHVMRLPHAREYVGRFNKAIAAYPPTLTTPTGEP